MLLQCMCVGMLPFSTFSQTQIIAFVMTSSCLIFARSNRHSYQSAKSKRSFGFHQKCKYTCLLNYTPCGNCAIFCFLQIVEMSIFKARINLNDANHRLFFDQQNSLMFVPGISGLFSEKKRLNSCYIFFYSISLKESYCATTCYCFTLIFESWN